MSCNVYYTLEFRTTCVFGYNVLSFSLVPFSSRRMRSNSIHTGSRKKNGDQIINSCFPIRVFRLYDAPIDFSLFPFIRFSSILILFHLYCGPVHHRNKITRSIALPNVASIIDDNKILNSQRIEKWISSAKSCSNSVLSARDSRSSCFIDWAPIRNAKRTSSRRVN